MSESPYASHAAECIRQAENCLRLAERLSIAKDGMRMTEMARQWISMAKRALDREDKCDGT
jgi:hypothetical protein